ncbi:uncharacterized protein LOC135484027 [Lineus longissimus]|uniref:uncharacterized protein LOC135484027 n=1 Tax=Lineus longissimus TaxID=88925 RepID=UPI00315D6975
MGVIMRLTGLNHFGFPILYFLCAFGRSSQQAVCNDPAALGMKNRTIEKAQITVPGVQAEHMDKLRYDTGEGLCIDANSPEKSITIDFQNSGQARGILSGVAVQLPKSLRAGDGYVKQYTLSYEDSNGTQQNFPGTYNGPSNPGIALNNYERSDFATTIYKAMNKVIIKISDYDITKQRICLRIELYGCQEGICNPTCKNGGKCINDNMCKCPQNYGTRTTQCQYFYPSMVKDPTITVLDDGTEKNEVKFQCNINDRRPNVTHTASWIIDGQPVIPNVMPKPENSNVIMISELHQRDLYHNDKGIKKITQGLRCDVTACWSACGVADSSPRSSKTLTPTVTVISPTPITLVEGEKSKVLKVTLGGPPILFLDLLLASNQLYGTKDVRLEAQFDLNDKHYTCAKVSVAVEKTKEHCGLNLTSKNWHGTHEIHVKAVMDGLYIAADVKRKLYVVIKHIDNHGNAVSNEKAAVVNVTAKNIDGWGKLVNRNSQATTGSVCFSLNDPHMSTFDNLRYEGQYAGEFTAYRNKNYKVNAYFINCAEAAGMWSYAKCNCGVAVQAEDEVIVFSSCPNNKFEDPNVTKKRKYYFNAYMFLNDDKSTLNGKLPSGTRVYATEDGMVYYVYLPTGTYVKIMAETDYSNSYAKTLINFIIVPSISDREQSKGFCGHFDGKSSHPGDLRKPDGSVYSGDIHQHMDVWRETGCSLFHGTAKVTKPDNVTVYCQCIDDSHTYDCGENKDADPCPPQNVEEVTSVLIKDFSYPPKDCSPTKVKRSVYHSPKFLHLSKRAVVTNPPDEEDDVYLSFIFNASYVAKNPSWSTESDWTQTKAKTFCEDYLLNKDSVKNCKLFFGTTFQSHIENCIVDIKLTDGTTFAEATLKNIISLCLAEAEKYPPDVTILPGGIRRTVLYDSLCLNDCSDNGVCENGVCVCNSGFYGSGCSLTKDKSPIISYTSRDGLCNVKGRRDCTRSEIFGTGYIKSTDLTCRITPYDPVTGARDDKQQFKTYARYINFNLVLCPHNGTNGTYLIAVSNNNGNDYSKDELLFMAYDSVCFKCFIDQEEKRGHCSQLSTGCTVGSGCYMPGEVDPKEKCNICNPSQSITEWSRNAANPNCPLDNTVAIIAGVTSALLVIIIIVVAVGTHKYCRRKKKVSPSTEDIREKVEQDKQKNAPGQTCDIK